MNKRTLSLLLGITLSQSACILATSYTKLEPQLEQLEKNQQYGSALDALANIDPKDPDYNRAAEQRRHFEKLAAAYEQQIRKETTQKQQKGDWAGALDLYDEALDRYPKSAVIRDGLAILHQQQLQELDRLESQRLIRHGEWLRGAIPVFTKISTVNPRSRDAQTRLEHIHAEANGIARELALIGNRALTNGHLDSADTLLSLAHDLSDDPAIEESLKVLREHQKQRQQQKRQTQRLKAQQAKNRKEKQQVALNAAKSRYQAALEQQHYLSARAELAEIEKIDRDYETLAAMQLALQQEINAQIEKRFEAGVNFYSRGQFEQAAKEWRAVLKLDPEHQQARENLDRAEKVIKRLNSLKAKQNGAPQD